MRDSYGTYDGSKPEPPYECPECSDLRAKLQAAEERIAELDLIIETDNGMITDAMQTMNELKDKLQAAEERIVELEEVRDLFKRGADSRLEQINDLSKKLTDSEITSNLQRGFFNAAMDRANKAEASRDKWKRLAVHNGKRLEAIRQCLYQDHFPEVQP